MVSLVHHHFLRKPIIDWRFIGGNTLEILWEILLIKGFIQSPPIKSLFISWNQSSLIADLDVKEIQLQLKCLEFSRWSICPLSKVMLLLWRLIWEQNIIHDSMPMMCRMGGKQNIIKRNNVERNYIYVQEKKLTQIIRK